MATARSEADMRSLDRARMYTIFKPLDPEEQLPREQVLAAKRFRSVGRWELAGAIWLPLLVAIMVLGEWANAPASMALSPVPSPNCPAKSGFLRRAWALLLPV